VDQGLHTIGGHDQGLGRAPSWCGQPQDPLWLPFGPRPSFGKNKTSRTCFVQFREYFLCSFSETQKQQKTGNWHYGILSIGQFRKSHKNATKCNETQGKWCKNKHGASKIIDTFETYHGPPPGQARLWGGPLVHPLTSPFRLYILLDKKTLGPELFSRKHNASHRHRRREIGWVQKLFPAPCWRGESPLEAFFITMPASEVMCE
jgi:hypothetical protein